jgi:rod shape-determining protein MreB
MSTIGVSTGGINPIAVDSLKSPRGIELTVPAGVLKFSATMKGLWASDLAMDLGTANTLIYRRGEGIVLNEPSVVAIDDDTGKVLAVGQSAKEMYGKTASQIKCIRPMKDGVIADFGKATLMIESFLNRVRKGFSLRSPRIVIGVPSGITQVEKRAVIDAAGAAGCGEVLLIEEPMAAALGAELPVDRPGGNMIVDIGGGTTEVALLSFNSTLYSQSIRVAGDEMDEAIQKLLWRGYGLQIGVFEAERIKMMIGSAMSIGRPRTMMVTGRDSGNGAPRQVELHEDVVREALEEPLSAISSSVMTALEQTSPELAQDIVSRGVCLAGGGSLLRGLAERLQHVTGIKFVRSSDPLTAVVRGAGIVIDHLKDRRILCIAS